MQCFVCLHKCLCFWILLLPTMKTNRGHVTCMCVLQLAWLCATLWLYVCGPRGIQREPGPQWHLYLQHRSDTHTPCFSPHTHSSRTRPSTLCVCVADTNTWTELVHPQLSVPRAGHSIITMALANQNLSFKDDGKERNSDRTPKTLLVFGGGDNEGNFYSDLTTLVVAELLDQN